MLENLKRSLTDHRVAIVVLAALALIGAIGAVIAINGPQPDQRPKPAAPTTSMSIRGSVRAGPASATGHPPNTAAATKPALVEALPRLSTTDDPNRYAREVALALLQVDPTASTRAAFLHFWRRELPTVVYIDAAAKGLTLAQQNHDAIDNLTRWWIPPQQVWDSEAADHTRSRFTITSVTVPDYWANAVANGTFRDPGLHMERVMGVLIQTYDTSDATPGSTSPSTVGAPPASPTGTPGRGSTSRAVVIDLGLLCGPTQPGGCRLVAPQKPPALGAS